MLSSYRYNASVALLMFWLTLFGLLTACSGGSNPNAVSSSSSVSVSSSSPSSSFSSSSSESSASSSDDVLNTLTISGAVTYDFVPVTSVGSGLNYGVTERRPVRGAVVELLDASNNILNSTATDNIGAYSLGAAANRLVRVRVKAQAKRTQAPTWDMKVTDNTSNNSVYALVGSLVNTGESDSQRNLHAASGWGGTSYSASRAAAPFAILDSVYTGLTRFLAAGHSINFPVLELRWSINNITAANTEDDFSTGEIGTSFFYGGTINAIYILGAENSDTDEYDRHVILHEWGHYIESALSRADSIGGAHSYGDRLDMRVAFSEGFGNAFSAMILDDPLYRDTGGFRQTNSFEFDVSETNHLNPGWYNESSIGSVLYHYYLSSNGKAAQDLAPILSVLTSNQYINSDALASIFLFSETLLGIVPSDLDLFDSLLEAQNINSFSRYGDGETNNGGYTNVLPVYKTLVAGGAIQNVCSSSIIGVNNKLAVAQFFKLAITSNARYTIKMSRTSGATQTDPDFFLYFQGEALVEAQSSQSNTETKSATLVPGSYVLEVYDYNQRDPSGQSNRTSCFDVQVTF